jgi:hypothetical protein
MLCALFWMNVNAIQIWSIFRRVVLTDISFFFVDGHPTSAGRRNRKIWLFLLLLIIEWCINHFRESIDLEALAIRCE